MSKRRILVPGRASLTRRQLEQRVIAGMLVLFLVAALLLLAMSPLGAR
jgi:hypothetical protein